MYRTNARVPAKVFEKIPLFDNRKFLSGICSRNQPFTPILTTEYLRIANRRGFVEANRRLRTLDERLKLGGTGLRASADDEEISNYADTIAKRLEQECDQWSARAGLVEAVRWARSECERIGVAFPLHTESDEPEKLVELGRMGAMLLAPAMQRLFDPAWWRRQLRTMQARLIEDVARDVRRVAADREPYVSDLSVARRAKQKRRNFSILKRMEAENEEGQTFTLAELMEKSLANPAHRRAELMVRIRGFEEVATMAGHVGVFITLTAPSRFHCMKMIAGRSIVNSKWDESTPREAQRYHLEVWEKIRAVWHRLEIRPYGFRVVEPNHDGTPHWHLLLFIEPEKLDRMKQVVKAFALATDGDEKGAKVFRVNIKEMNPAKGTAAGYIAKYISKNIDGFGIEGEQAEPGEDAKGNAKRIETWATTYRMRQFQQIGGPSVGIWRELRRLEADAPELQTATELTKLAHAEAKAAKWAAFVLVMGGPQVKRAECPLAVAYEETVTRYHEPGRKAVGVGQFYVHTFEDGKTERLALGAVVTRLHVWRIQRIGESQRKERREEIKRHSNTEFAVYLAEQIGVPLVSVDGLPKQYAVEWEEIPPNELLFDGDGRVRGGTWRAVSGAGNRNALDLCQ